MDDVGGVRDGWWISADMVMNIRFASNAENSLNSREPVSLSGWTLLRGVSNISSYLREKNFHHYIAESSFSMYQQKTKQVHHKGFTYLT
jgi:hypothetical protein